MRTLSTTLSLLMMLSLYGCGQSEPAPAQTDSDEIQLDATVEATPMPSAMPTPETSDAAKTASGAGQAEAASPTAATLNYIPDETVAAVVLRPSKAMNNPIVKEIMALVDLANPNASVMDNLEDFKEEVGVELERVDHVLVILDQQSMASAPMLMGVGQMGSPSRPTVVVELVPGQNAQNILDSVPNGEVLNIAGGQGVTTPDGGVLFKVSDSRLIYSSKEKLESLLNNASSGTVKSMLAETGTRDFSVALDFEPVKRFLQGIMQSNPDPTIGMILPMLQQIEMISISADLEATDLLNLTVNTPNAEAAAGVSAMLNGYLGMGRQQYQQMKSDVPAEMQAIAQQVVDGTALKTNANAVSLTVPRPQDFEKLPEMLKPSIEKAASASILLQQRNHLKMIGLAFHNYHDIYNHFPAVDSNGDQPDGNVQGKGLSWRVHLLPLLEHQPLYSRFHLDEPWDSEHNKTLIAEMPEVFGSNPEGKTSLHVFVGEKVPFAMEQPGARIRDFIDGTSNTILVVRAAEETSEVWTKPGGLKFDSENPYAALGNVGETFTALFSDGSVRELPTSLDKGTFSNLLQHQDGNVVDF